MEAGGGKGEKSFFAKRGQPSVFGKGRVQGGTRRIVFLRKTNGPRCEKKSLLKEIIWRKGGGAQVSPSLRGHPHKGPDSPHFVGPKRDLDVPGRKDERGLVCVLLGKAQFPFVEKSRSKGGGGEEKESDRGGGPLREEVCRGSFMQKGARPPSPDGAEERTVVRRGGPAPGMRWDPTKGATMERETPGMAETGGGEKGGAAAGRGGKGSRRSAARPKRSSRSGGKGSSLINLEKSGPYPFRKERQATRQQGKETVLTRTVPPGSQTKRTKKTTSRLAGSTAERARRVRKGEYATREIPGSPGKVEKRALLKNRLFAQKEGKKGPISDHRREKGRRGKTTS